MRKLGYKNTNLKPFDKDAGIYFDRAGIKSSKEQKAVNDCIQEFKKSGLWLKMDRIYLISPTSAAAAVQDARTDGAMLHTNNPTWSTNGFAYDGISQWSTVGPSADNNELGVYRAYHSAIITSGSMHLSIYNRASLGGTTQALISTHDTGGGFAQIVVYPSVSSGVVQGYMMNNESENVDYVIGTAGPYDGFYNCSRNSTTVDVYLKSTHAGLTGTATRTSPAQGPYSDQIEIAQHVDSDFAAAEVAYVSVGSGLLAAEVALEYKIVQNYQAALGRNV